MSARAFTTGPDIFLETGEYNPGTPEGQRLLAYELTHVVQQGGADVQRVGDFGDHPLRILSASLKSTQRTGMPGHAMLYTWTVDAGPDPKGPVDRLSLFGSSFEWWEEIENPYDFDTDSPEDVAEKRKQERAVNTSPGATSICLPQVHKHLVLGTPQSIRRPPVPSPPERNSLPFWTAQECWQRIIAMPSATCGSGFSLEPPVAP